MFKKLYRIKLSSRDKMWCDTQRERYGETAQQERERERQTDRQRERMARIISRSR